MNTLTKKPTQRERIKGLFIIKHSWTNHELRDLKPPVYQFPVRIKELKEEGMDIRGAFDVNDKKTYLYTYYPD